MEEEAYSSVPRGVSLEQHKLEHGSRALRRLLAFLANPPAGEIVRAHVEVPWHHQHAVAKAKTLKSWLVAIGKSKSPSVEIIWLSVSDPRHR
jgi:hypothetical protein